MKKLLTLALALFMSLNLTGCSSSGNALERVKKQGYLVVGTSPDYAPNEFYIDDSGKKKMVGTDIALAQYIADNLGVELRIQESDFNTVIAYAQAGIIDMGLSGFAWDEKRDEVVDFSIDFTRDYGDAWQGLMIRKEDADKYKVKEDIRKNNAKVGAQAASIQYTMAKTIADESNIVQLADTTNVAAQLSTGDLDAFVCTSTQAFALMETYDNIMILPEETFDLDPNDEFNRTGAIFSKDEGYDPLIEEVNKIIQKAKTPDENGVILIDEWYREAQELMPFDLTDQLY